MLTVLKLMFRWPPTTTFCFKLLKAFNVDKINKKLKAPLYIPHNLTNRLLSLVYELLESAPDVTFDYDERDPTKYTDDEEHQNRSAYSWRGVVEIVGGVQDLFGRK